MDTETNRTRAFDILEADIVDRSWVTVEGANRRGILIEPIEHQTVDTRKAVDNGSVGVPAGLDIDCGQQGEVVDTAPRRDQRTIGCRLEGRVGIGEEDGKAIVYAGSHTASASRGTE